MQTTHDSTYTYLCYGCGATHSGDWTGPCAACGEPFSLLVQGGKPSAERLKAPAASMWDYAELLPIRARENIVTLGEGATPLVETPRLAKLFGFGTMLCKNEMSNPTGSFKDRQVSVGISHAREIGADTVAVVSSGNVACAASAYAARAGMRAILLMHGHAAASKITQAAAYGGQAIQVDTPSAGEVFDLCIEACKRFGWYHLSTAGLYEPFNVEGAKTIAYEIYQQTGGYLPDWVVAPVGGGGLLGGIWRGFLDLQRLRLIDRIPRLAGIQASGCAPFVDAVRDHTPFLETLKHPWPNPKTVAGGIADDIIFDGHTVLPAIRTTDGAAIAVDDEAILEGQRLLATREGLLCEPTCAVVIAGLKHLPDVTERTRVCCVLTGSGIKDLAGLQARVPLPTRVAPSLDALKAALEEGR
ncbi:MAG: threonine synthase [FCB group bacterium]|jgi:threonine synthase|nr:threonine synthase [FCB group bacterium]